MATVRVSFLLGGERFHGRPNRSSVLSDVPAKATRVNRAGPGCKFIRLRRLSHTRQYGTDHAVFLRRDARGAVTSPSPSAPARPGDGWLPASWARQPACVAILVCSSMTAKPLLLAVLVSYRIN